MQKFPLFPSFVLFQVFVTIYYIYSYLSHIIASNTVIDDVTNWVLRGIFIANWK